MKNVTIWQFGLHSEKKQKDEGESELGISLAMVMPQSMKQIKQGNVTIQVAAESLEDAVRLLAQVPKAADMRVLSASQNGSAYVEEPK